MSFANPWVLVLLILIPIIIIISFFRAKRNDLGISIATQHESFASITDKLGFHLPFILRLLCLSVLIVALARPQLGQTFTTSKNLGVDIMVAVDTSQSMLAVDLDWEGQQVDRLTVVKHIVKDFIQRRASDRLGLIVFGDNAYTQCPLTTDHGAIIDLLKYVQIGMVGNTTAIGSAIAVAVKRLKDLEAKSKILILMTDGQNTSGSITPLMATELAKELGIKIYTIGVGRSGEVPFRVDTPVGPTIINQVVAMDEDTLIQIAESTGGQYFRGENTESLKRIYGYIDELEKTEIEVKEYNSYKDIFEKFLWAAFLLFLLELLLGNTIFFRIN